MRVTLKPLGIVRNIIGTSPIYIDVPEGSTVRDVLVNLVRSHAPRLDQLISDGGHINSGYIVILNGSDIDVLQGEDTVVAEGDVIVVLPHVQGGALGG